MNQFHLGDLLTVTSGRLLSPTKMDGCYKILNYMTGESLFTHQLPRAAEVCKPILIKQFPWLDSPEMQFQLTELTLMLERTPKEEVRHLIDGWLMRQICVYGEWFDVLPLWKDEYEAKDPVEEYVRHRC
jgi:hypothetical protein